MAPGAQCGVLIVQPCPEHECHVIAPELACQLAAFAEQLEGVPRGPVVGELDERPAVVALRRRLLAEALRFLPAGGIRCALRRKLADALRGGGEVREPLAGAWRRDVSYREHARGRSRLAETLVVLAHLADEVLCRPDVDASVGRSVSSLSAVCERKQGRLFELPRFVAVVRLARRAHAPVDDLDGGDAGQVRPAQEGSRFGRNLPRLGIGRLASAEDEVDASLLLDRERQGARRPERVRYGEHAVGEVNAPFGAERQAGPQRLLGLWRPHRQRDHLGARERGRLRDGSGIERIEQERHAFSAQLFRLLVELDRVGARNLFDEADDLHVWEPSGACWPFCTTSTAISLRSRRC